MQSFFNVWFWLNHLISECCYKVKVTFWRNSVKRKKEENEFVFASTVCRHRHLIRRSVWIEKRLEMFRVRTRRSPEDAPFVHQTGGRALRTFGVKVWGAAAVADRCCPRQRDKRAGRRRSADLQHDARRRWEVRTALPEMSRRKPVPVCQLNYYFSKTL